MSDPADHAAPLPDGVRLRLGSPADAEALTDLHLDVWDDAYTGLMPQAVLDGRRADRAGAIERRRAWLSTPGEQVWLAEDDTGLVGFANAGDARDADPALPPLELKALYVRARVYGAGIGWALCRRALGEQPAYLWVLEGNARAERFYERQGFRRDGVVEPDPHGDHVRMVRR